MKKLLAMAPAVLALTALSGCGDDDDNPTPTPTPTPTMAPSPSPSPTPSPTPAAFDVGPCLEQQIPGTPFTVAEAVIPDTLTLILDAPSGFPNGRRLPDPVIDVTLAALFLDLSQESPLAFANLPLNPPSNDRAFRSSFPYLAAPQGNPPIANSNGSNFNFRTDSPSAYVRVDRVGMPAVATALIGMDQKVPYNDADPADDVTGQFVPELTSELTKLTEGLADDITGAGFEVCATPNS